MVRKQTKETVVLHQVSRFCRIKNVECNWAIEWYDPEIGDDWRAIHYCGSREALESVLGKDALPNDWPEYHRAQQPAKSMLGTMDRRRHRNGTEKRVRRTQKRKLIENAWI
jgi:hypothetical protein